MAQADASRPHLRCCQCGSFELFSAEPGAIGSTVRCHCEPCWAVRFDLAKPDVGSLTSTSGARAAAKAVLPTASSPDIAWTGDAHGQTPSGTGIAPELAEGSTDVKRERTATELRLELRAARLAYLRVFWSFGRSGDHIELLEAEADILADALAMLVQLSR